MKITGVKGMNDILPAEVGRWQEMERVAREVFALYGYREVRTPAVEHAQLFARGVGEATDIVNKEMYVFEDKGEELLALRPEGTAGTVRAFIEHGAYVEGPQKWFYLGPMFRRERPQKGRYRQFHQIGCEAFGIAEPYIDAEQIALVHDYFGRLGVAAKLKLNTVGDGACRPAYLARAEGSTSRAARRSSARTATTASSATRCACSTARSRAASRCSTARRVSSTGSASRAASTSTR